MTPLLHLATPGEYRAQLAAGVIAPPSLADVGFVHLSTPEQVALPADRMFHGRPDLVLLVLDPARIGVEVRFEPGVPSDPASMRFPHAYGPVPTSAVLAVLPYRPRPDGGFDAPAVPATDPAGRLAGFEPSVLRRAASTEVPVRGGVAVLTASAPAARQHNQLLIEGDVDAGDLVADADLALGRAGLPHRQALLTGARHAETAAALAERGWDVQGLVGMTGRAGGEPDARVEPAEREALLPMWDAAWRSELSGTTEAVVDVRYLALRVGGGFVASCLLEIDGATALIDAVTTVPGHQGRGYGDAVLATARALAGQAGCDLVGLEAATDDWPRAWYGRRGFVEVAQAWSVRAHAPEG